MRYERTNASYVTINDLRLGSWYYPAEPQRVLVDKKWGSAREINKTKSLRENSQSQNPDDSSIKPHVVQRHRKVIDYIAGLWLPTMTIYSKIVDYFGVSYTDDESLFVATKCQSP